jgi:hypothetical protein
MDRYKNDRQAQMSAEARFGFQVAARLTEQSDALPSDITERLKGIRQMVVDRERAQRTAPRRAAAVLRHGNVATLGGGDFQWRLRLGLLLAIPTLLFGLYTLQHYEQERQVGHIADIDTALLLDDLPPQAYADPGFTQYLRHGG